MSQYAGPVKGEHLGFMECVSGRMSFLSSCHQCESDVKFSDIVRRLRKLMSVLGV